MQWEATSAFFQIRNGKLLTRARAVVIVPKIENSLSTLAEYGDI